MSLSYQDGKLSMGHQSLEKLASEKETPFFVYNLDGMKQEIEKLKKALGKRAHIHYAVKANSNPIVLKEFASWGLGADVVSAGEAKLAIEAGIPAEKIIFSGVGKTKREIRFAIENQFEQLNVESPQELQRIGEIAKSMQRKVKVAFRMNPDVNPETHPYITTGFKENKFGMDEAFIPELLEILSSYSESLELQGLTIHIGSQLRKNDCIREAIEKVIPLYQDLCAKGYKLKTFDVGGGIGIDYEKGCVDNQQVEEYGNMVRELLQPLDCDIYCEPGRVITACHGVLVSEVQYIKETQYKNFAILDTGMHHVIRPSLYSAEHRILPLVDKKADEKNYDIVGPICESSDFLGKDRQLPELKQGELLAICETGAYGRSMASEYNAHSYPEEVVIYQGEMCT